MALGSCTANAITAAVEFLDIKDKIPELALSRLFLYYNERAAEGTINYDSGASLRDGIKVLADQGVCQESLWPYDINKFTSKPSDECYQAAQAHKAIVYQRLTTLNDMRACLAAGFPLVFGITVYESFESDQVAKSGIVPMPSKSERSLGGHALLAVGYNDQFSTILVRNSWGPNWGINGYFTLPYQYISNNNLADDFWTIRKTVSE
jgi:C1A family cysteine protease